MNRMQYGGVELNKHSNKDLFLKIISVRGEICTGH